VDDTKLVRSTPTQVLNEEQKLLIKKKYFNSFLLVSYAPRRKLNKMPL